MEIFNKVDTRGDGEHLMTFAKRRNKEGNLVDAMLLTTVVQFIASNKDGQYLIAIGDIKSGSAEYKVITNKELKSKNDFAAIIRPYSLTANATEFEFLLNFWRINMLPNKLVYIKDLVGRFSDELVDFWILDKELIFKEIKSGVVLKAKEGTVAELKNNQFDLLTMPYDYVIDFKVSNNWYWVDNKGVAVELRPMTKQSEQEKIDVKEYLKMWGGQYGNQVQNMAVLGWFIACMYMEEVTKGRGLRFFPYLALSGLTQTGKTSLISNYLRFWGIEAKPVDYTQVTPFVEIKQLGQVSCMPVWRDEFREGVGHSKNKETILRSLYNMSTLSKGTASQQLINYEAKTSLLLSGEDSINDPATRRRCIYFGLADEWKLTADRFEQSVMESEEYFSHLFYIILKTGFNLTQFREVYMYAKANLRTVNDKGEEGICYAALGAVFGVDFAKSIIDSATGYWDVEKRIRPGLVQKTDLFDQFWESASIFFDQYGYWDVQEIYGEMRKPKVLDVIWFKEKTNTYYINIKPLIKYVYVQGGFSMVTNINMQACEAMITTKLKTKLGRQIVDDKQIKGIEVNMGNVESGGSLETILNNVYKTYNIYSSWRTSKFRPINDVIEAAILPSPK